MSEPGPRVAYWMSAFCELMQQPHTTMPTQFVFDRLRETFRLSMISYNCRDADGGIGFEIQPRELLVAHADMHRNLLDGQILNHHPLIGWFAVTKDQRPWTSARVPTTIMSKRHRAAVDAPLRSIEIEQQLAINYRLDGPMHRTFVLARSRHDFDEDDLLVAGYVQRALHALDYQIGLLNRLQPADRLSSAIDLGLTGREIAVLELIGLGLSTRMVSRRLDCSPRTVEKHLERIHRKLGVADRLNAVRVARMAGAIDHGGSAPSHELTAKGGQYDAV